MKKIYIKEILTIILLAKFLGEFNMDIFTKWENDGKTWYSAVRVRLSAKPIESSFLLMEVK